MKRFRVTKIELRGKTYEITLIDESCIEEAKIATEQAMAGFARTLENVGVSAGPLDTLFIRQLFTMAFSEMDVCPEIVIRVPEQYIDNFGNVKLCVGDVLSGEVDLEKGIVQLRKEEEKGGEDVVNPT